MAGMLFDEIVKIEKMNPYHGRDGRFTTAQAATSFTYKPGASTAHDRAIEREKERNGETRSFKGTLYHGSPATDIEEFDMNRAGQNTSSGEKLLFFTDSKQMAEDFSYERLEGSSKFFQRRGEKGRVYEVDVEMKNALDLRNLSEKDIGNLMKLDVEGILTKEIAVELSGKNNQLLKTYLNLTAASLSELGYDGLIANTGKAGHNSVEYAVVDGKQAKIRKGLSKNFDEILKYNDKHDPKTGQFASKNGGGAAGGNPFPKSKVQAAVYHGTTEDFDDFDTSKSREGNGTIFFSANEDYCEEMISVRGDTGRILTAYINMENPLEVKLKPTEFSDPVVERKYIREAKQNGNDGVIFECDTDDELLADTFYSVFDPKQISVAETADFAKSTDQIVEKFNSEDSEERDMIVQKEKLQTMFDILEEIEGVEKANPYHDRLGRFASAPGGGAAVVGHNGVTTKEQDAAYMAAVEAGDMETAQRMVIETAKAVGAQTFANPDTTAYSIRRGPEPQETVTTYKTFFVDNEGNPSALFVEGTDRLPVGVWLDAKDAYHFQADNGKMYTPSRKNPNSDGSGKTGASVKIPNDQVRQELIDQGFLPPGSTAKDVTALAYRPGWHAGDLPFFPQGGKQGNPEFNESGKPNKRYDPSKPTTNYQNIHRWNQVVFECEMAADIDYTKSTSIKSGPNKGKIKYTDMQEMPTDGYYKFATNPMTNSNSLGNWYISGSLKINRALTQKECDDILAKNGFKPQEWEGGKLDLGKLNYNPNKTDRGTKLLDPVTYDNNGKVIPLSQRFDNSSDDVRKSADETVCTIYKTDEDKRLVFGWASISYTVDGEQLEDLQKDMIDPEDLEEAVYEYVLNFRDTGEEHIPTMRKKGKLVESCVLTEEKQRAMGIPAGTIPIGWWIGFKIEDDDAWERVKNGTYRMFSIEGKANREPVEKSHEEEREEKVAKTFNEILGVHSTTRTIEKNHPDRFDHIEEVEKSGDFDHLVEVEKFNPYHGKDGRFASANSATSFTYAPGKSNAHDLAIARAAAKDKVSKAKEAEPALTKMMQGCATAAGGEMVGLDFCVKGEGSLTRKIKTEMSENGSDVKAALARMRDVNRYTMQLGEDNFVSGFESTMKTLQSQGHEVVRVKNTLGDPNAPYRGVNTNIKAPDGSIWELQFHTAKSLEIKEVNHKLYETQRLDKTPAAKRAELGRQMAENAASIPSPAGIEKIAAVNKL